MSYAMTSREAALDERMSTAPRDKAIQAVEQLARAEAALRDALANYARNITAHTIDVEAVCNTLDDEIPAASWLLELIEDEYRGY